MTLLEQVPEIEKLYETYGSNSRTVSSYIPKLCAKLREVAEALKRAILEMEHDEVLHPALDRRIRIEEAGHALTPMPEA